MGPSSEIKEATTTKLDQLAELGQSIWFDYIRRAFIETGQLEGLVEQGLRGVTSNPTIFEKAITGSADYDQNLEQLSARGESVEQIYETFALYDIRAAADLLRPVYDSTDAADGFVSLEVPPALADDEAGTVAEAKRLHAALRRPNVMIKVPATTAGVRAVERLIGDGIPINVTLLFAVERYEAVAEAYIAGLERFVSGGGDPGPVGSVASFFVSRVDTAVDQALDEIEDERAAAALRGKAAIANAKIAYAAFERIFSGARWEKLAARGARVQRLLWASTGTKNPSYPDTLYVDELIGPHTVNTMPPATLTAFLEHGTVKTTLTQGLDEAEGDLAKLAAAGIDLGAVTDRLLAEGLASFAASFDKLIAGIADKRERLRARRRTYTPELGQDAPRVEQAIRDLAGDGVIGRIWNHDHTVWKPSPDEISNRLGWLQSPEKMAEEVPRLERFASTVREAGYTHALLLGMGGSSLAPEVFRRVYGVKAGYLDLAVLDSTDPAAVQAHARRLDPKKTLFIVSTKSGGTVETHSFFRFFYNWTSRALGEREAGRHFIAITDPGSALEEIAKRHGFRATFLNDPTIGGRYSALTYYGLAPAALLGIDLATLLDRAATAVCNAEGCNCPRAGDNVGGQLGAAMGSLAESGRDKLTLVASPPIAPFGPWLEQLIAESTGKEGKGVLPVVDEPLGPPEVYGDDRLFVELRLGEDETHQAALEAVAAAGHPVIRFQLEDLYDLGSQFFVWEMATAVAGHVLGIQPFDQPNVESAKVLARKMVAAYEQSGSLPEPEPTLEADGIRVYADAPARNLDEAVAAFLGQARPGDYVALQAYLPPTPEIEAALARLRRRIRDRLRVATTSGFGPRFLHSTGQLHKGDGGNGLFLQLTAASGEDVAIPPDGKGSGSSLTFGTLELAQALGDRQALLDAGRRVLRLHLGTDAARGLERVAKTIG